LYEGVGKERWDTGHDDQAVLEQVAQLPPTGELGRVGHRRVDAALDEDLPEHELEWEELLVGQVDESVEELVPVADRVEENIDRDDGLRQRQHDAPEEAEVVAAVD